MDISLQDSSSQQQPEERESQKGVESSGGDVRRNDVETPANDSHRVNDSSENGEGSNKSLFAKDPRKLFVGGLPTDSKWMRQRIEGQLSYSCASVVSFGFLTSLRIFCDVPIV